MPRVSEFFGIVIYVYFEDTARHRSPHFHAEYGGERAVFSIPDADMLAGRLPKRQTRMVQGWAAVRARELEQAWVRALNRENPGTIAPLA